MSSLDQILRLFWGKFAEMVQFDYLLLHDLIENLNILYIN